MTPLVAGALAALCVTGGLLAVPLLLDRGPVDRLAARTGAERSERRYSLIRRLIERLASRIGPRLAPGIRLSRREALARRLDLAGRPGGLTVQRFIGIKGALALLTGGFFGFLAIIGGSWLIAFVAVVTGWFGPDILLSRAGRLRQERIERDLPDFLDILAVTVRAGLGYRSALQRVAESLGGPAGEEILTALRQMDLGATRRDAFLALRTRNDSESLSTFVGAQLQAEELGVPLSEALNDIALDMRRSAAQNARRRAARAAPRISLIVTTLIVPGSIILILASMILGTDILDSGVLGVAERILARGEGGAGGWLESACKGILTFRAGILLITVVELWGENGDRTLPAAAILVAAITTAIPLRYWDRVGPTLVRHPAYLAAELVLSTLILLLTGVNSPFFYYTLTSALLGGIVYGWGGAALFSVMLIGVYFWVVGVRDEEAATLVMPAFYPLIGCAGAALRGLLDRQAETESELASQSERARLARDMHDSLAKTVSGMGFAALALARRIERDPEGAAEEARRLAEDARQATREAREIIVGLRADAGEQLPLAAALQAEARRWGAATNVRVELIVEDVGELDTVAARELEWILREALGNVERHARANQVTVRLRRLGGRAVLTIADDGAGFEVPDELEQLAQGRHFGVTGMRERAQLAGGDLSVESAPGEGCVLSVWMPAEAPTRPEPAPAAPADTLPARSVPGYTWR